MKHTEMHKEKVGKLMRINIKKRVYNYECTRREYQWKRGGRSITIVYDLKGESAYEETRDVYDKVKWKQIFRS